MKKYCIVNTSEKKILNKLEKYGYLCIPTEKSADVSKPVSLHADVLYLKTGKNNIYVSECQVNNIDFLLKLGYEVNTVKLKPGYKTECRLNMLINDNLIMCNPKTSMDFTHISNNKQIIYTSQGYTKCSTAVLSDNSFITEDENIYNALISAGKNCLLIKKGDIKLDGYDYGFIGGASIFLEEEKTLFFTGNIKKHTDYNKIKIFSENFNIKLDYIEDMELYDIGGAIIL